MSAFCFIETSNYSTAIIDHVYMFYLFDIYMVCLLLDYFVCYNLKHKGFL